MTAAVYAHTVARSALALLRAIEAARQRPGLVTAGRHATAPTKPSHTPEREQVGLGPVLHSCWDLRVQPATLLERAQAATSPFVTPTWVDPHETLVGIDQGRLHVAFGPGDMAALAGSTVALLRMMRLAQQQSQSWNPVSRNRIWMCC
jgi:hypothetical protein